MKLPKALTPKLDAASTIPFSESPDVLDDVQRTQFLDLVAQGSTQHRAAATIGVPFWVVGATRRADERFNNMVQAACEIRDLVLGDIVEETLVTQAVDGYTEDVYHQGVVIGERTVYGNNGNAQFLLRGLKRDKYGTDRSEQKLSVQQQEPPPAVRNDQDARRLLAKMQQELLPVLDGKFEVIKQTDVEDLL